MKTQMILNRFILIITLFAPFPLAAASPTSAPTTWSIKQAVEYAISHNPDSKMAKTRILLAQAKLQQANSVFLPRIDLLGSYGQTDNPMYSFGNILNQGQFHENIDFNDPGRTDNFRVKAELQYNLYNGGRDRAAVSSSLFHQESVLADRVAVLNQLAYEVVKSFQQIIQSKEMVEARESAKKAIEASILVGKARHQAGTMLRQELLDLEVQAAGASENLIQARHTLSLTKQAFNNLLGIAEGSVEVIATPETDQKVPTGLDYSARPEIDAINKRLAALEAQLKMVSGERLPKLDSFASYQYDHGFITDGHGDSWMAGLKLSYSLYDGKATKAKIAAEEAQLLELQAIKQKTELALNLELQQAQQMYKQAIERMAVTKKMVTLAEESARLSRARFQEGVILSSDLIDVETRLTDALVRDSLAKALYKTSIANLRRTVGFKQF